MQWYKERPDFQLGIITHQYSFETFSHLKGKMKNPCFSVPEKRSEFWTHGNGECLIGS